MIRCVQWTFPKCSWLAVVAAALVVGSCGGSIEGESVTGSPVFESALPALDDGRVRESGTSKVLDCHTGNGNPVHELECIIAHVFQDVIADNPGACAEKVEDALAGAVTALEEFLKPDDEAALGNLEGAVGDLEAAFDDGNCSDDPGNCSDDPDELETLMDDLAGIARAVAVEAMTQGGDPGEINDAEGFLKEGDGLRDACRYKDAVNKYKDAVAKFPPPSCPCFSTDDIIAAGTPGPFTCSSTNLRSSCNIGEGQAFLLLTCVPVPGGTVPSSELGCYLLQTAGEGSCSRKDVYGAKTQNRLLAGQYRACVAAMVSSEYCP